MPQFSFFKAPIQNITPNGVMSLSSCYSYIISDTAKSQTEHLRSIPDKAERGACKTSIFDAVTPSGEFSTRSSAGLLHHSGILCLDFDHVGERLDSAKRQIADDATFPTMLVFTSPSGDGLKVLLKLSVNENNHVETFMALTNYFDRKFGLKADQSGKDVSRACFLCYDPEAIYHESETPSTFRPEQYLTAPGRDIRAQVPLGDAFGSTCAQVEHIIKETRARGIDLTTTYEDWLRIGFALADELGEGGRSYYHQLSQLYPRYTVAETDKQYDNCMKSSNGKITIGTLFHLAKMAGIDVPSGENSVAHSAHSAHSSAVDFDDDPALLSLPTITDAIGDKLPEIMKQCISGARNTKEADVRFLSSLAVISASLPAVHGVYAGHKVYPHVFIVLDGPASSGKGSADTAELIARPIHEAHLLEYEGEKEAFTKELKEWKDNGEDGPEPRPPKRKVFFIPANSTSSAFIAQLADNGGTGMVMDMELDTVNGSFRSEHGNYSPVLRKAAHHETISMRRRGNDEYIEVSNPRVALCIAGTPGQINRFVGNAENGFFSRIQFYCLPLDLTWLSPWTATEAESVVTQFEKIGECFYEKYYCRLARREDIVFTLDERQKKEFDVAFESAKHHLFDEEGVTFLPSVHRMGLFCFRAAMILSVLKAIGDDIPIKEEIVCDDDSFDVAMCLSQRLVEHIRFVYRHLPKSRVNPQAEKLLRALPSHFGRKDYAAMAEKLSINPRTADRYVNELVSSQLIRKDGQNKYIIN